MHRKNVNDALARIRAAKEGKRPIDSYEVKDESAVQAVDEEEYERRKKLRKNFIAHDEEHASDYDDEDEEEVWNEGGLSKNTTKNKGTRQATERKLAPPNQRINNFFSNTITQQVTRFAEDERKAFEALDRDLDQSCASFTTTVQNNGQPLDSHLAQQIPIRQTSLSNTNSFIEMFGGGRYRKINEDEKPNEMEATNSGLQPTRTLAKKRSGDGPIEKKLLNSIENRNVKRQKTELEEGTVQEVLQVTNEESTELEEMEGNQCVGKPWGDEIDRKKLKIEEGSKPLIEKEDVQDVKNEAPLQTTSNVAIMEDNDLVTKFTDEIEDNSQPDSNHCRNPLNPPPALDDGGIPFFLLDVYEEPRGKSLYLFGKVYSSISNKSTAQSCCVIVQSLQRNLYVHPKQQPPILAKDVKAHEDELWGVKAREIMEELTSVFDSLKIKQRGFYPARRHFALDIAGIPKQRDLMFLKVAYSTQYPRFPQSVTSCPGQTYSHIFGAETSLTELFLIKRKIMGPSWLLIRNWKYVSQYRLSSCCYEIIVDNPKDIAVMKESSDFPVCPPLNLLSLALDFSIGQSGYSELALTACYWNKNVDVMSMEFSKPTKSNCSVGLRRISGVSVSENNKERLESYKSRYGHEDGRKLYNAREADPDVVIGHDLYNEDFNGLVDRFKSTKFSGWSKLSRHRNSTLGLQQIKKLYGNGAVYSIARHITTGRLICDTTLQARDMLRSRATFDLPSILYDVFSSEAFTSLPIPTPHTSDSVRHLYTDLDSLKNGSMDCLGEAIWSYRLMVHLKMLNLTRELSLLSGCLWQWSLMNRRADRNDFLLLHKFHDLKYICPERQASKFNYKQKINDSVDDFMEDNFDTNNSNEERFGRKKAAYTGGLVLEPKSGLYDTFVLLLDFNSLYPSLIQEFNICFTTTEIDKNGDAIVSSFARGILPELQKNLVERRRQVKAAMKRLCPLQTMQRATLEIRQMALKLTANSMYGCLGFTQSRFCARPLAKLITQKGRELLEKTKNTVESRLRLNVIYGDTDSIMVDSGLTDDENGLNYEKALKIADEIKKMINSPKSQLELELDGMFIRLLLLMKKKYACKKVIDYYRGIFQEENKGLDIVRRDWCKLTKHVGNEVLKILFDSKNSVDAVVEKLHDLLRLVNENLVNEKYSIDFFLITKGLTKMPDHYADASNQPHVMVAKRLLASGRPIRAGLEIQYVMCVGHQGSKVAERAYHVEEVEKQGLKIDINWYKKNQILPPIGRLCQHVSGTNLHRLAQCLGIEDTQYEERFKNSGSSNTSLQVGQDDNDDQMELRFLKSSPFTEGGIASKIECSHCNTLTPSIDILEKSNSRRCGNCNKRFSKINIRNFTGRQLYKLIQLNGYYRSNCIECSGTNETKRLSILSNRRCLNASCPKPENALQPITNRDAIHVRRKNGLTALVDHLSFIVKPPKELRVENFFEKKFGDKIDVWAPNRFLIKDVAQLRNRDPYATCQFEPILKIFEPK